MDNFDRAERDYLSEPEEEVECIDCGASIPEGYEVCHECTKRGYIEAQLDQHDKG